jgi:glycosyltransferase involved in cell wall biosynthesis
MRPEFNFMFLHNDHIGYGRQGLETLRALTELGAVVHDGLPGSGDLDLHKKSAKICKDILFLSTPTHIPGWYEGQRAHLFTMWETTQLPELLRRELHNFETILTPSRHCVDLYKEHHPNVHYVPLGVDTKKWEYRARRKVEDSTFFDFLVCGSGKRKGVDLVHRAFIELFAHNVSPHGPIPRLIIKDPRGADYVGRNVEVISGWMPSEDEVELYASAHCYVQPSRGEGWGLQPLQALSQGCPTILTKDHGHSAFAAYGIPIESTLTPVGPQMSMFGDCGQWWEPNFNELKQAMADVYARYHKHALRARKNSAFIHHRFDWKLSATAVLEALGSEHLQERFSWEEIPSRWFTPKRENFKVVLTRKWRGDFGGIVQCFEEGVQYQRSADLKRLFFEMGLLDPSSGTEGLLPNQLWTKDLQEVAS